MLTSMYYGRSIVSSPYIFLHCVRQQILFPIDADVEIEKKCPKPSLSKVFSKIVILLHVQIQLKL